MAKKKKSVTPNVELLEDLIDEVFFEWADIIKMPEKWAINSKGDIINVYPHALISIEGYNIKGVHYLPHKNYFLPEPIFNRYVYWDDLCNKSTKVTVKFIKKCSNKYFNKKGQTCKGGQE